MSRANSFKMIGAANPNGYLEPLTYTMASDLEGRPVPDREWIAPGWVPSGQVTMLSGDGGVGKSLLALQLMAASALVQPWLGIDIKPLKVFGIFCEDDDDEIQRRLGPILDSYGAAFGDLEDRMGWFSCVGSGMDLAEFPMEGGVAPTMAFQRLGETVRKFGAQIVVIDSLHDVFTGNENNRVHARQFIRLLQDLAQGIDGAVILTAHPSVAGRNNGSGESGSTAWNNAVRSRLYLSRPTDDMGDNDARILARKKSNYARIGDEIRLEWRGGVLIPPYVPEGAVANLERRDCANIFLELLARAESENRPVSENSRAANYAPKMFAKRPPEMRHRYDKRDFERAMESLFTDGLIEVVEYRGPSRHPHRKIIIKEGCAR